MIYTVVWDPAALDELAVLWLNAPDRHAITTASATIDATLRTDPYGSSKTIPGGRALAGPALGGGFQRERSGLSRLGLVGLASTIIRGDQQTGL